VSSRRKRIVLFGGGLALVASAAFLAGAIDPAALALAWRNASADPLPIAGVLALYSLAFLVRALVWTRVLPGLRAGRALAALHVSLAANHLLPLRLGEALRVTDVVRRGPVPLASATASTIMLRAADVLAVVALAAVLGPRLMADLVGVGAVALVAAAVGLWIAGLWWLKRLQTARSISMRTSAPLVALAAVTAWVLESAVMWQAARWAGFEIGVGEAVLVTAVTIAAQTVALAPGGIGTYEAAATAVLVALGVPAEAAFAAALAAHAVKTAYALGSGAVALFVPSPSAFGRLRLAPPQKVAPAPEAAPPGPIVLFMPAHDEEEVVASVVERVPAEIDGRPVRTLVIDDGSSDRTARRAAWAGAEVISLETNRGLGAAVRRGLKEAGERGAAAIAFCDADGEYAPEELERLVRPILDGEADYVVGSRLTGQIRRMLPHRRVGNRVLTALLSFVARRRISDGQSGYRAFSAAAAADAEVIHDFNYAQVLTLDLLAKGYRYLEVPIGYSFRESGSSFVKLGRYLRHVLPAVHRELNGTGDERLVLDDMTGESLASATPSRSIETSIRA
jgi:uncharacterized membrane protein YbhN (UPF0104 family)